MTGQRSRTNLARQRGEGGACVTSRPIKTVSGGDSGACSKAALTDSGFPCACISGRSAWTGGAFRRRLEKGPCDLGWGQPRAIRPVQETGRHKRLNSAQTTQRKAVARAVARLQPAVYKTTQPFLSPTLPDSPIHNANQLPHQSKYQTLSLQNQLPLSQPPTHNHHVRLRVQWRQLRLLVRL